jgi:DNA-binding response OmpR family regulator
MNAYKKRILIVDDDSAFANLLAMTLRRTGQYETRQESNPKRAVAAAREFRPQVILLDVIMPDMDGGDVALNLAQDLATHGIPLLFMTGLVDNEEVPLGGLSAGGHRVLPKPVSIAELMACIEAFPPARLCAHTPPSWS